ncbi:hypothetical protein HAX54_002252, partial [Datura stramonium]|nr:hypothetical protein [Datura stramonium]
TSSLPEELWVKHGGLTLAKNYNLKNIVIIETDLSDALRMLSVRDNADRHLDRVVIEDGRSLPLSDLHGGLTPAGGKKRDATLNISSFDSLSNHKVAASNRRSSATSSRGNKPPVPVAPNRNESEGCILIDAEESESSVCLSGQ